MLCDVKLGHFEVITPQQYNGYPWCMGLNMTYMGLNLTYMGLKVTYMGLRLSYSPFEQQLQFFGPTKS